MRPRPAGDRSCAHPPAGEGRGLIAEALAFAAAAAAIGALGLWLPGFPLGRPGRPLALLAGAGRLLHPRRGTGLAELDRRLLEAGRPAGLRASDLLAAKLAAALAGAAAGAPAGTLLPGRLGVLVAVAAPLCAFFAPDAWLARRRRDRVEAARRDLPALLDLLRVSVEAGASVPQALAEVGRRSRSPLAGLWHAIAAQVAVGVPLAEALERHRRELPMREAEAFTAALARAARHGAPLADTLAARARDARRARRRVIQERAARAGPKIQLVVALLLVPSVLLLVAAGLLGAFGPSAGGLSPV